MPKNARRPIFGALVGAGLSALVVLLSNLLGQAQESALVIIVVALLLLIIGMLRAAVKAALMRPVKFDEVALALILSPVGCLLGVFVAIYAIDRF